MITLVKFHLNKSATAARNNYIITKTLGKTGVLDWDRVRKHKRLPKDEEFWFVEIVKERGAGTKNGLFVLDPVKKVSTVVTFGLRGPRGNGSVRARLRVLST